ncbi:MAG: hypothetical protein MRERV_69c002 [Mycoplasmataceae bacterium RV_VA103A]|nr:MAG: hypothetical protein MRERV_69c002 [Mycoplasmataceae bacterium RV_VA103A]
MLWKPPKKPYNNFHPNNFCKRFRNSLPPVPTTKEKEKDESIIVYFYSVEKLVYGSAKPLILI